MIAIIDYGNLFSIYNWRREVYDYPLLITVDNIPDMKTAEGVIVPGVGAFDDCIRNLVHRFQNNIPTFIYELSYLALCHSLVSGLN